MKRLITTTTMILILITTLLTAFVNAQNTGRNDISAPYVYTGVESATGTFDGANAMVWGNTFVLNSTGEYETAHLTVSINHFFSRCGRLPRNSDANCVSLVAGGTWSLVVFRHKKYVGTLYGVVEKGGEVRQLVNEDGQITGKRTSVRLSSRGGLGIYEFIDQVWEGDLQMTTDADSPQTTATLDMNF